MRDVVMIGLGDDAQICLHPCLFNSVRWYRGEMEHFLDVLNQNVN
jgi:hypothetical protein